MIKCFPIVLLTFSTLSLKSPPVLAENLDFLLSASHSQSVEKTKNIKKLLEITGVINNIDQVLEQTLNAIQKQYPKVPETVWNSLKSELDEQELIAQIIDIYDQYLTHEEIEELLNFYQSPLGQKMIAVFPKLSNASLEVGEKYRLEAAQRVIQKLSDQGYLPE